MEKLQKFSIADKDIYVFEDHATALSAWAEVRRRENVKPNLITLDCHTDTHQAFLQHFINENNYSFDDIAEKSMELCGKIDFSNPRSVEESVNKLKNDEHINAAVKSDILNYVFIISYHARSFFHPIGPLENKIVYTTDSRNGTITLNKEEKVNDVTTEYYYGIPEDRIYELPPSPGFNPPAGLTEQEHEQLHCDMAIEKEYLDCKIAMCNAMAFAFGVNDILSEDFILDMDLDYFRTAKSIEPTNPSTFYELIRRARAVTIALEPQFVIWERIEGQTITSDFLYPKLINHIENALGKNLI